MPNKVLVVCCILFLVLALLFGLSGCGSNLSAQQISSNTINNSSTLQTARFTQTMQEVFEVIGGSNPGNLTYSTDATGSVNLLARELEYTTNVSMYGTGVEGKQNASGDFYLMGGWMYMKISVPGEADQWTKQESSNDTWVSEDQIDQQVQTLKAANKITNLGAEKVDDVDCYIIQITPESEINALMKSGLADELSGFGLSLSKTVDWSNLVKYYSVKEWISKDKFLPVKLYSDMSLEILPQDLANTTEDIDRITINISTQTNYYDYNKPVDIQLPPDARNA
jgi:hypothetical protein